MVEFKPGAEPGLVVRGQDQFRLVIERAGIGLFDRDNAVFDTWKRWGEEGSESSYPISSAPPLNAKAGVIDISIRHKLGEEAGRGGSNVATVVAEAEKIAGRWANVVSIQPLTLAEIRAGAVERESVRQTAIDEGAGAGFSVITKPFTEAAGSFADRLQTTTTVLLVVAGIAAIFIVPRLLRPV